MTYEKQEIQFESIETTPAAELLKLSYRTLSRLIREARQRAEKAQRTADWLEGIKIEKSFRQIGTSICEGGNPNE